MPPRMAKSPGSVTVETGENPIRPKKPRSRASSTRSPTWAAKEAPSITFRAGRYWVAAFSVVSRMKGFESPEARIASVDIRRAKTTGLGETRS